jgi:membrane-associated phospholipid phosphatase
MDGLDPPMKDPKIWEIEALAMAFPRIVVFAVLFVAIIHPTVELGLFLAAMLVLESFLVPFLKHSVRYFFQNSNFWHRPITSGEGNGGCGVWKDKPRRGTEGGTTHHELGFPSGHAALAALAATYWSLQLLWGDVGTSETAVGTYVSVGLLAAFALLVIASRVYFKCHSILQVIAGGILGAGVGYGAFKATDLFKKDVVDKL